MKQRFRLYRRKGGICYLHDSQSGKQSTLGTRERSEAVELFSARMQAHRQAHLNLQLARTFHRHVTVAEGDVGFFGMTKRGLINPVRRF